MKVVDTDSVILIWIDNPILRQVSPAGWAARESVSSGDGVQACMYMQYCICTHTHTHSHCDDGLCVQARFYTHMNTCMR